MYIVNPFDREGWLRNLFSTHPSVGRRVKRLEAIEEGRIRPSF
jgi:Zn-dependent protease with chaperone function